MGRDGGHHRDRHGVRRGTGADLSAAQLRQSITSRHWPGAAQRQRLLTEERPAARLLTCRRGVELKQMSVVPAERSPG
jgi:hypothetical protein